MARSNLRSGCAHRHAPGITSTLLEQAVENLIEGFALIDRERRLLLCNQRMRNLLAPIAGVLVPGTRIERIMLRAARATPDLSPALPAPVSAQGLRRTWAALRTRLPIRHEQRGPAGTWLCVSIQAIEDGSTAVTCTEITELKHQAQALRVSEQRFRDIVEISSDWIWETGPDLRFSFVSDGIRRISGIEPSDLIGKSRSMLAAGEASTESWQLHMQDLAAYRPFRDFEYRMGGPDQRIRHVRISGKPLFDEDGEFLGYRGTGTDITELVAREQALRESEQRLASITANLPGTIFRRVVYPDGRMTFPFYGGRPLETLGLDAETIMNDPEALIARNHPDDQQAWYDAVAAEAREMKPIDREHRMVMPSGEVRWVRVIARPSRGPEREVIWDGIDVDVTDRKRAETAATQAHTLLRDAIETLSDSFALFDADDRLVLCNEAYRRAYSDEAGPVVYGKRFEDILREGLANRVYLDAIGREDAWLEERLRLHRLPAARFELQACDRHWWLIQERRTRDGGSVGIRTDITEIKQAEARAARAHARLLEAIESMSGGLALFDAEERFIMCNRRLRQMLRNEDLFVPGVPFESIVRTTAERGHYTQLDGESQPDVGAAVRRRMKLHRNVPSTHEQRAASGWLEINTRPTSDGGRVVTYHDVHERRQREQALRESEERYELAMQGANEGLWDWVVGTEEVHLSMHARMMLDLEPGQQTMRSDEWTVCIHPEDRQGWRDAFLSHLKGETEFLKQELRILDRGGAVRWVFAHALALRDDGGRAYRIAGSIADITDRKHAEAEKARMEAQLREAQRLAAARAAADRAKSEFLAHMSHELRTPLNGILGYAQVLQQDDALTVRQREGLDIIRQCGDHLLSLINDILDQAKIEAGRMEVQPRDFELMQLIGQVVAMFEPRAREKGLDFICRQSDELADTVWGDDRKLRQVLINLLSNAVKFTDSGQVTLRVARQDERVLFEVTDTGIGIGSGHPDDLFKPFAQLHQLSAPREGTGLGLAISQRLVSLMGGRLTVASRPEGGTRFRFHLDLPAGTMPIEAPQLDEPKIIGYQGPRRKVLIVDDKDTNRAVLVALLQPPGFECVEAVDGEDCLAVAQQHQPDAILMDLVMPGIDGLAATRQLRRLPEFRDVLIVAMSASVFATHESQGREAGCDEFLPKPIRVGHLFEVLGTRLGLTWVHADPRPPIDSADPSPLPREIPAPIAERLLGAARTGHSKGVAEQVAALDALGGPHRALAEHLKSLNDQFAYERIASLVERYHADRP